MSTLRAVMAAAVLWAAPAFAHHTAAAFADGRSAAQFTMEDPDHLVGPVIYAMPWDHRPDVQPPGVACDPEIGRRHLEE